MLLPGLDGTGELFAPLLPCLPAWIRPRVVGYPRDRPLDYRGHLEVVRAALPRGGSFVILGESFSGPLALMAAAGRPAGLRGVGLCPTFVRKPFRLAPAWVRFLTVAPVFGLWPLTIRPRYGWRGGAARPLVAAALRAIESVRPEVIAARARAVIRSLPGP